MIVSVTIIILLMKLCSIESNNSVDLHCIEQLNPRDFCFSTYPIPLVTSLCLKFYVENFDLTNITLKSPICIIYFKIPNKHKAVAINLRLYNLSVNGTDKNVTLNVTNLFDKELLLINSQNVIEQSKYQFPNHLIKIYFTFPKEGKLNWKMVFYATVYTKKKENQLFHCLRARLWNRKSLLESISRELICDGEKHCSNNEDENEERCAEIKIKNQKYNMSLANKSSSRWQTFYMMIMHIIFIFTSMIIIGIFLYQDRGRQINNLFHRSFPEATMDGNSTHRLPSKEDDDDHQEPPPIYNECKLKNYPMNLIPPLYPDLDEHIGVEAKFYNKFDKNKIMNKKTVKGKE